MASDIKCPVCGSEQIHAEKKGFSAVKAVAGAVLVDPLVGAIAGSAGKDKIILTCLRCGHQFSPGDPLSINHTSSTSDTDKLLANKNDLPQKAYFKCSCGKISLLEMPTSNCPKCGRRLTKDNIISEEEAKNLSQKGGCLGLAIIPLVILGGLLAAFL